MATSHATLSFLAQTFMIGMWFETMLYGVDCAMFALCMFILFRDGKMATLRWVLIVMCTVLFVLCTAHVGVTLQQLLDAFVYAPADVPDYSVTYLLNFSTATRVLKDEIYGFIVIALHIILIWRLYVVFMYDWRVVVLPIMLSASCVGTIFAASTVSARRDNGPVSAAPLVITAWALGLVVNLLVTLAIAGRLWWMGRKMASLSPSSTNRFASSIYVAVESGAMAVLVGAVVLALYESSTALAVLDAASQLAALASFLIVVQLGAMNRHRVSGEDLSKRLPTLRDSVFTRASHQ